MGTHSFLLTATFWHLQRIATLMGYRDYDSRVLAAKRRKLAQMKGTDVMIELLIRAQSAGHHADYILFDTWFSSPAQLIAVKDPGLDSIGMIKKSSRIYYEYEGEQLSMKKFFGICKKRPGRRRYLLAVNVLVGKDWKMQAKIVCVHNKKKRKAWVSFICTNQFFSEEELIRIYEKKCRILYEPCFYTNFSSRNPTVVRYP